MKRSIKYCLICLVIFINPTIMSFQLYAQSTSGISHTKNSNDINPLTVGINYQYGFFIPHAKEVLNVRGKNPRGIELDFGWQLNSLEVWNDCNCYPRLGFLLSYFDYDYPDILGDGYSAALNFTYFFGLPSRYNFILNGKAGVSLLSKPYDKHENPQNMSYCTKLNYLLSFGVGFIFKPVRHYEIQFIVSMNHKSNAAYLEPNGGINFTALSLGLGYTINPVDFNPKSGLAPYLNSEKRKRWDIAFSYGISSMPYPKPGQASMYSLSVLRSMQVWRIGAVTFGAELEYNGRAHKLIKYYSENKDVSPLRASVLIGFEFLMGRTIFSVQLGGYFYREYVEKDDIYQRFGLVYKIFDHIYAGINFKSYGHFADHLDLRIVYSF